jgi:hypothetical protein
MTFPAGSQGDQVVWAIDETDPLQQQCSKTNVVSQYLPTITKISLSGGSNISASVSANIDGNSKRVREGSPMPLINFVFVNTDYNHVESVQSTSQSIVYYPQYRGTYRVNAVVSDGSFTKQINMGLATILNGATPPGQEIY